MGAFAFPGERAARIRQRARIGPPIDVDLESFRRDLEHARARAAGSPPNYFWAGSVSGACVHCHGGEL